MCECIIDAVSLWVSLAPSRWGSRNRGNCCQELPLLRCRLTPSDHGTEANITVQTLCLLRWLLYVKPTGIYSVFWIKGSKLNKQQSNAEDPLNYISVSGVGDYTRPGIFCLLLATENNKSKENFLINYSVFRKYLPLSAKPPIKHPFHKQSINVHV